MTRFPQPELDNLQAQIDALSFGSETLAETLALGNTADRQIKWGPGLGSIEHLRGPSDQPFSISAGAGQDLILAADANLLLDSTTGSVELRTNNTTRFFVQFAGHFVASPDNTLDIGNPAALRPRTAHIGTSMVLGGDVHLERGSVGQLDINVTPGGGGDGDLRCNNLDSAAALELGSVTATSIVIGRVGQTTTFKGGALGAKDITIKDGVLSFREATDQVLISAGDDPDFTGEPALFIGETGGDQQVLLHLRGLLALDNGAGTTFGVLVPQAPGIIGVYDNLASFNFAALRMASLEVNNIDVQAAGPLVLGSVAATAVGVGRSGQSIGFFGAAVALQVTDSVALTDSSGGTANDTVVAVSGSGADAAINDNFADLAAKYNALRDFARAHGLMA